MTDAFHWRGCDAHSDRTRLFSEKRYGYRNALACDVEVGKGVLTVRLASIESSEGISVDHPSAAQTLTSIHPDLPVEELSDHRPIVVDVNAPLLTE